MADARPRVSLIGTGRMARALARSLDRAGWNVACVAGRRLTAAARICRPLAGAVATTDLSVAASRGRLLSLAVSDGAVARVASELAAVPEGHWPRKIVLHHAGALGLEPLKTLARRGADTGLLHPLQVLGEDALLGESMGTVHARIEGSPAARRTAERLCADLGLQPLRFARRLDADARAAYHAAASLMSNDLVALLASSAGLLQEAGLSRRAAVGALVALAQDALAQAADHGLRGALTGPVARGDEATLRSHLRRLRRHSARAAEVHRLLSRDLLELVEAGSGGLEPQLRRRLLRLLDGRGAGRSGRSTL